MLQSCPQGEREGLPASAESPRPVISIIVPVRNEAASIEKLLRELLRQNYEPECFEVIVADGQSTDGTRDIVLRLQTAYPNLKLLSNPRRLSSAGRNLAIQAAAGDIILIVDGHCDVDAADYLLELTDAFARSGADCVGRPQPLNVAGATPLQRAIALARASWLGHHPDSYIYSSAERFVRPQSVAVAYRRAVFEKVGLFDEDFDACEDVEFNNRVERAGFRCFFSPRVRVGYHPRSSLRGLFRQMARYGRGRMRLLRKQPETFAWPSLMPALFVLGLAVGCILAAFSTWIAAVYAGLGGVYATIVFAVATVIAMRSQDWRVGIWLPLVFVTIHVGAGVGLIKEWIRGCWRRAAGVPAALVRPSS
jgi:succinoglycan biosynthesis protein ExoA